MQTDRGWRRAVLGLWGGLLWAGLFSLLLNLLMLAVPLYSLQLYDRVLGSGRVETLALLSLAAAMALVVMGVLDWVRTCLLSRIAAGFESRLFPAAVEAAYPSGAAAQAVRDLASLRQALIGPVITALFDAPWLPLALAIIWVLHPDLAAFVGASTLLLAVLAIANDLATKRPLREAGQSQQQATSLAEALQRRREAISGLGMLETLTARLVHLGGTALARTQAAAERGGAITGLTRFVRLVVQSGVMGLGAWLVLERELTPGGMLAASILASKALAPVEQMVAMWKTVGTTRESWSRLKELLSAAPLAQRTALPTPKGQLEVEAATVRTANGRALLRDVAFKLEAGECLVVVGPSGAGKSTLCRLLAGTIEPDRGAVRLDGAQLRHYPAAQLACSMGYLPQDVGLLPGSIAENIARMADAPAAQAVLEAALLAGAHEMILRLPEGYETRLEEGGFPLSGGQRQRVGLARALYGNLRLLVLDEPNANLDGQGEAALMSVINRLKQDGVTIVIVTHRPHLLQLADKVMVLEEGVVARFGPKEGILPTLIRSTRAA
jgi:PrtD family type I secretion system ABC transporter